MWPQRSSRQDLIEGLRTLIKRLGRTLRERDSYEHDDSPTHMVYVRRFGSWRKALEAAGILLDPQNMGYDRETLLNPLRALAEDLGKTPSLADLARADGPCATTYRAHFGSWKNAVAEAGLELRRGNRRYGRDELSDVLRDLAQKLGHAPSMAELWEREDLPSPSTYKYRFGRWNDALRQAGLKPRHTTGHPGSWK